MIDNTIPTNQFHPYQAPDAIPHSSEPESGLSSMMRKAGLSPEKMRLMTRRLNLSSLKAKWNGLGLSEKWSGLDVNGQVTKVRDLARSNSGMVLGGLAAVVIGTGLVMQRRRS